ncbi:SdpI family protein [Wenyingzhuangia aestuarii]|uniref:SdpI family protein n=1 Tax=Wenyingzhuangia aestuarii TaxID=1647582 RepID=UPI00143A6881|nr:SdpI family protein [Wenyingzhuangia aestuarii]NJB82832.1 putative membrane protein [Wenyingzhuangia aestuarii]
MWTQLQLLITPILLGAISIITGLLMLMFPPKEINALYGYRTKRSMSNQQLWDFSQKFSAKKMIQTGILLLIASFIIAAFKIPQKAYPILVITGIIVAVLSIISVIFITEQKLKQKL